MLTIVVGDVLGGPLGSDSRARQSLIAGAACRHPLPAGCPHWTRLVNVTLDGGGVHGIDLIPLCLPAALPVASGAALTKSQPSPRCD